MTIAERRAREAAEAKNPWRAIALAASEPEGMICELRRADLSDFGRHRFVRWNGEWYRTEPPSKHWWGDVMEYRPIGTVLSSHLLTALVRKAEYGTYEYRGGEISRKPKPYKLYWRDDD